MAHIHEKIDFCVEVFTVYNNKVLLRIHDKYNKWLSVGGHIELDEDPNQAAIREVREEVGLDIELFDEKEYPQMDTGEYAELIPPQALNRHRISPTHEHIALTYFARAKTDKLILSATEKTEGCHWFSDAELDDPTYHVSEHIKRYAHTALRKLKKNL